MVYFDNAATTPVPKAVADAMYEVLTAHFGNPSSQYPIGVEMKKAVEGWRAVIAGALGCPAERLYFTSCGTESDNWAIQAALWQNRHRGRHIITTAVEHSAVLEPCKLLAQQGYEVTYLKPGRDGNVTAEQVADALREDTALVSVMLVNNETGCVFPAADIAALLREKGSPALLHCDAVQGFLKVPCDPEGWGVDLMSLSGHKVGGPKGVGALYIGPRVRNPRPLLPGGGQERGARSGTEATAQIAGFAKAVELRLADYDAKLAHGRAEGLLPGEAAGHGRRGPRGRGYGPPHSGGVAGRVSQRQHRNGPGCAGHLHLRRLCLPSGEGEPCGLRSGAGQKDCRRRDPHLLLPRQYGSGRGCALPRTEVPPGQPLPHAVIYARGAGTTIF